MISATVVLKSVAGALWRAVRRSPGATPPAADSPRFLTIGALTVNAPENPQVPGLPTSLRSLAYEALLRMTQDLVVARFTLTRALDKLETHDVLEVLDEVGELVDGRPPAPFPRLVTPRDEEK